MGATPADDGERAGPRASPSTTSASTTRTWRAASPRPCASPCARACSTGSRATEPARASSAVAARTGWSARDALDDLRPLRHGPRPAHAERLRVSEDAAAYLTRGTPGSLWGLVDMEVDHFLSPRALMDPSEGRLERLRRRRPVGGARRGPRARAGLHRGDAQRLRATRRGRRGVRRFDRREEPARRRRRERRALHRALRREPGAARTIFDIAAVEPLAREYVGDAGLSDRIDVEVGDMFGPHFRWATTRSSTPRSSTTGASRRAPTCSRAPFGRCPGRPGPRPREARGGRADAPLANALVHLDTGVDRGTAVPPQGATGMLTAAGFEDVERVRTAGYWSLVSARRPR